MRLQVGPPYLVRHMEAFHKYLDMLAKQISTANAQGYNLYFPGTDSLISSSRIICEDLHTKSDFPRSKAA